MAKKDAIEDMLLDLEIMGKRETALDTRKTTELDVADNHELAKELVNLTHEDRKMADKLFELFYPEIMSGQDRSQASKEALSRALELKIDAGKNIIELLKIMKKEEKPTNTIGLFFNEKKAGISIESIKEKYSDEE